MCPQSNQKENTHDVVDIDFGRSPDVQAGNVDCVRGNAVGGLEGGIVCNPGNCHRRCVSVDQKQKEFRSYPPQRSVEASMSQPDWVIELLDRLEPALREEFEERSAIMQYEGKMQRDHAECLALLDIIRRNPMALRGNDHLI